MKNWKTTLLGTLLATAIAVQPYLETGIIDYKNLVLAALISALSFVMKDHDVTGGAVSKEPNK
jgi:hypothetical protein